MHVQARALLFYVKLVHTKIKLARNLVRSVVLQENSKGLYVMSKILNKMEIFALKEDIVHLELNTLMNFHALQVHIVQKKDSIINNNVNYVHPDITASLKDSKLQQPY